MKKKIVGCAVSIIIVIIIYFLGEESYALPESTIDYLQDLGITEYEIHDLGDYEGLTIDPEEVHVSQKEVDEYVEVVLESYAYMEPVTDRAVVQDGDFVYISYVEKENSTVINEVSGAVLKVGAGYYDEQIEEALVGKQIDTPFVMEIEREDEKGEIHNISSTITVDSICRYITFSLEDEYIKERLQYNTTEEYLQTCRETLEEEKRERTKSDAIGEMYKKIIDTSDIRLDEKEVAEYAKGIVEKYKEIAYVYDMTLEEYCEKKQKITMDGFYEKCYEEACDEIEKAIIVGLIAEKEGILVTKQEIEEYREEIEDGEAYYVEQHLMKEKQVEYMFDN